MGEKDYFRASEKDSFAEFTINNRFPKIFQKYCSGDYETFINKTKVNKSIFDYECLKTGENEEITLKDFFKEYPFILVEFYFYHLLLNEKKYLNNGIDFFAEEKDKNLKESVKDFATHLTDMITTQKQKEQKEDDEDKKKQEQEEEEKRKRETFYNALDYCFSANTSDLSQINSSERSNYMLSDINLLCDDREKVWEYCESLKNQNKRVDIICDNAGKELLSDLYLAVFFLEYEYFDKVVFHLKSYPFFCSDATKRDFGKMIYELTKIDKDNKVNNVSSFDHIFNYLSENKIEIKDEEEWCKEIDFKNINTEKVFADSSFIIVKGDLNYRRLIEDRKWDSTDSFSERTKGVFGEIPILAPRVIKSEVLIGVSDSMKTMAETSSEPNVSADKKFTGNGKWGVLHFREPKKKLKIKKGEIERKGKKRKVKVQDNKKIKKTKTPKISNTDKEIALIILGIIGVIGFVMLTSWGLLFGFDKLNFKPSIGEIDFTLLLTGYGVLIATAFFLPQYLVNSTIKDKVTKYLDRNLGNAIQNQTNDLLQKQESEVFQLNADVSRMISLLLKGEDPMWTIGWAFRALNKYLKVKTQVFKTEFINAIYEKSIFPSIENFAKKNIENMGYDDYQSKYDLTERVLIRTLKDISDFEFIIKHNLYELEQDSEFYRVCCLITKKSGLLAKYLVAMLLNTESESKNQMSLLDKSDIQIFTSVEDLETELYAITEIPDKEEHKDVYKKEIKNVIYDIHRRGILPDGKPEPKFEFCKRNFSNNYKTANYEFFQTSKDMIYRFE